ncbi:DEKNAAC104864 [Brettanomyces naardenensis]|uniref:DEKNAAC104864 n=1 Tax=Brettanomyces naardenensis TaxID=13370 RepID=A0A448YS12_BRENA|nr:DEKNAAC104864 [Brettanomyces naardenensis]
MDIREPRRRSSIDSEASRYSNGSGLPDLLPVSTVKKGFPDSSASSYKSSISLASAISELGAQRSSGNNDNGTNVDTHSAASSSTGTNPDLDALDTDSSEDSMNVDSTGYSNTPSAHDYRAEDMGRESHNNGNSLAISSPLSSLEFLPVSSSRNRRSLESSVRSNISKPAATVAAFAATEFDDNDFSGNSLLDGGAITSEDADEGREHGLRDLETYEDEDDNEEEDVEHLALADEKRVGDEIPSVAQKVDNQDKLYESLNILDDVKKLKDMKFFDEEYNGKMNNLKRAQLGMLVDMVRMNENSLNEFYDLWNTLEEKKHNGQELKGESGKEPEKHTDDQLLAHFDINESETFNRLGERNELVAADIDKIKESISSVDEYTKGLWDRL